MLLNMAKCQSQLDGKFSNRLQKLKESSPYDKNFKYILEAEQREVILRRQAVNKLSRTDIDDKYLKLCDENCFLKTQNNDLKDKLQYLMVKMIRLNNIEKRESNVLVLKKNCLVRSPWNRASSNNSSFLNRSSSTPTKKKKSIRKRNSKTSESVQSSGSSIPNENEKFEIEFSEKMNSSKDKKIQQLLKAIEYEKENSSKVFLEKCALEAQLSDLKHKQGIEMKTMKRKMVNLQNLIKKIQENGSKQLADISIKLKEEQKRNDEYKNLQKATVNLLTVLSEKEGELLGSAKTIEILRKEVIDLEFDKRVLINQQDRISSLLKKQAKYEKHKSDISNDDSHELLIAGIDNLRSEKISLENCRNELLGKIGHLQNLNDRLLVEIESIKMERNQSTIN